MADLWTVIADQLQDRVSGPMKFRIVLQPLMATFLAIRSGLADAKSGKDPYFWSFLIARGDRLDLVKDGWKSVGRLFILAMVLDLTYQILVQSSIRLRAALFVAIVLAIVPYVTLRGIVNRIAVHLIKRPPAVPDSVSDGKTPHSRDGDGGRS